MKKDNPKITFRPSWNLRQKFRKRCFNLGTSQDSILIELITNWLKKK